MRTVLNLRRVACITVVVLSVFGCQTDPVKAPAAGRPDLLSVEDYPQIVATDQLHPYLAFSPATVTPSTQDRPMSVSVPFRSIYDKSGLNLQYRFRFVDDGGRPLRDMGFRFIHIRPRIQYYLEAASIDHTAKDWRLEIHAAH